MPAGHLVPHCVVTSAGWLAVAAIAMSGAILGHSVAGGNEGLAFVAVLAAGLIFETIWYSVRHTSRRGGDDRAA